MAKTKAMRHATATRTTSARTRAIVSRSPLARPASSTVAVIAPGPAISGIASGKAAIVDAKISPDGKWISFVREHNLLAVNVTDGKEHALTTGGTEEIRKGELDWVYPEELELDTAHWWSPDSKSVAYLQFDISHEPVFPQVFLLKEHGVYLRYTVEDLERDRATHERLGL